MTPLTRQVCVTIPTVAGLKVAGEYIFNDISAWRYSGLHLGLPQLFSVLNHRTASILLLLGWSFVPFLPFQIIWSIPRGIVLGALRCVGFGSRGPRRGQLALRLVCPLICLCFGLQAHWLRATSPIIMDHTRLPMASLRGPSRMPLTRAKSGTTKEAAESTS
jgi:hypothetical protein